MAVAQMVSSATSIRPAERILFFIFPSPQTNFEKYPDARLRPKHGPSVDSRPLEQPSPKQRRRDGQRFNDCGAVGTIYANYISCPFLPPSLTWRDRRVTTLQRSPR